ncbi:hypothetical protein [Dulcicalothrix desertica]|nr:hypothetical protein [Dulcicalothrix desertica]
MRPLGGVGFRPAKVANPKGWLIVYNQTLFLTNNLSVTSVASVAN